MKSEPPKWLVTGAAGFIGSNLVEELLSLGRRVVGLDDLSTGYRHNVEAAVAAAGKGAEGRFTFVEGDVRDPAVCRRACEGVSVVLHQAALCSVPRSVKDPLATHDVNVSGALHMLIAARETGVQRFVYASSSSVYGDHPSIRKREDEVGKPLSPYAVSKRAVEFYAQTFQDHYGLETIGLRYFNVFGQRQDPEGPYAAVIPKWIGQMLSGERCTIYGDGETSRDFCNVDDVVQANLLAASAPGQATGRVYNVAYGERTTLTELHAFLAAGIEALDSKLTIEPPSYVGFRPGDVRHSLADTGLARELLGYAPASTVREGLATVINWYMVNNPQPLAASVGNSEGEA